MRAKSSHPIRYSLGIEGRHFLEYNTTLLRVCWNCHEVAPRFTIALQSLASAGSNHGTRASPVSPTPYPQWISVIRKGSIQVGPPVEMIRSINANSAGMTAIGFRLPKRTIGH